MQLVRFPLPGFESLLAAGAPGEQGRLAIERFPNGELTVAVDSDVEGRTCVLLGTIAPPGERLLAVARAADALSELGARRVVAMLPYLAYARQDAREPGTEPGIAWVGRILRSCGVDELLTVDVHSPRAVELLGLPATSLSPAAALAAELRRDGWLDATVVAPDEGAIGRCRAVAEAAGIAAPVAHLRKERAAAGVSHRELLGELGRRAVVVDDILDTGGTLISCCHRLRQARVEEIRVIVTHGLFTGQLWRELRPLVAEILITDTVPELPPRGVRVVTVSPLLEAALAELAAAS